MFAVIEFVFDLLPGCDVRWDRITGLLRVGGAGLLAYFAAVGEVPAGRIIWGIMGVAVALFTYGVHAGARLAAKQAGTNVFVSPVTCVTETCMIFAVLLPLSAIPALSALMLGFTALAGCLVIYLIFPSVKTAYKRMVGLSDISCS